jgi:hypothetical protein
MQRLHCNEEVRGVAEFNNELDVVSLNSSTVQVFNVSSPFGRLADIQVGGLINAADIVVCSDTSKLYIADFRSCAIWQVNLLSYKRVDKFISNQWRPWSLSTKSRRLLFTPTDGNGLFIYDDNGDLLKQIKLPH